MQISYFLNSNSSGSTKVIYLIWAFSSIHGDLYIDFNLKVT